MNVNVDKLRGKITENGLTQEKVAAMISIDKSTFSRKMKSLALDFSIGEMHQLVKILNLSTEEASQIFLANNSHYCENAQQ